MKTTGILLLVALTASTASFAEQYSDKNGPDFDALANQLQLDESSTDRLKSMMQSHRQQMETARQQKQKKHEMREQHRQELLTVLNYEQLYKFEQYMRQFHPRHKPKSMAN